MYKVAARKKFRWNHGGKISVEDLWDLSLESLDSIAIGLHNELQQEKVSFLNTEDNKTSSDLQPRFDIVKDVIATKLAEREAAKNLKERRIKRNKLLQILQRKQDAALEQRSEEDILKELDELGI